MHSFYDVGYVSNNADSRIRDTKTPNNPETKDLTFTSGRQTIARQRLLNIVPNLYLYFDNSDVNGYAIDSNHLQCYLFVNVSYHEVVNSYTIFIF